MGLVPGRATLVLSESFGRGTFGYVCAQGAGVCPTIFALSVCFGFSFDLCWTGSAPPPTSVLLVKLVGLVCILSVP